MSRVYAHVCTCTGSHLGMVVGIFLHWFLLKYAKANQHWQSQWVGPYSQTYLAKAVSEIVEDLLDI